MQRALPAPLATTATILHLKIPLQSQLQQTTTNKINHKQPQQHDAHSTVVGAHDAQKERTTVHVNTHTADDEGTADDARLLKTQTTFLHLKARAMHQLATARHNNRTNHGLMPRARLDAATPQSVPNGHPDQLALHSTRRKEQHREHNTCSR